MPFFNRPTKRLMSSAEASSTNLSKSGDEYVFFNSFLVSFKSDDVAGRTRIYESIVKGEHTSEPGLPESFNVLVKELQSLGLDVELVEEE